MTNGNNDANSRSTDFHRLHRLGWGAGAAGRSTKAVCRSCPCLLPLLL